MKKLLIILILFPLFSINAQENDSIKSAEKVIVTKAAILPVFQGCEAYENNNTSLAQCLNNNLLKQISTLIKPFKKPEEAGLYRVMITFILDDKGKLNIEKLRGEGRSPSGLVNLPDLDGNAKAAFQALADKVNSGEITVQPVKDKDGNPVNIRYTLPIGFN